MPDRKNLIKEIKENMDVYIGGRGIEEYNTAMAEFFRFYFQGKNIESAMMDENGEVEIKLKNGKGELRYRIDTDDELVSAEGFFRPE